MMMATRAFPGAMLMRPPESFAPSPLLAAAACNDASTVRWAVENERFSIDVQLPVPGSTPGELPTKRTLAQVAAFHGSCDVVAYLMSKGADPNARSVDDGVTALHTAALGGSVYAADIIALLLRCGADRNVIDNYGRRPADLLPAGDYPGGGVHIGGAASGAAYEDNEVFSTNEFRMFGFKILRCTRPNAHDWTCCPFAHPGEKARRRDPRRFVYEGTACPDFRKGSCKRGDACEFAHGVFECWLHPSRYRTQPCKDGASCPRRVCFFAHSVAELRTPTTSNGQPCPAQPASPPSPSGPPLESPTDSWGSSPPASYSALGDEAGAGSGGWGSTRPPANPASAAQQQLMQQQGGNGVGADPSLLARRLEEMSVRPAAAAAAAPGQHPQQGFCRVPSYPEALAAWIDDLVTLPGDSVKERGAVPRQQLRQGGAACVPGSGLAQAAAQAAAQDPWAGEGGAKWGGGGGMGTWGGEGCASSPCRDDPRRCSVQSDASSTDAFPPAGSATAIPRSSLDGPLTAAPHSAGHGAIGAGRSAGSQVGGVAAPSGHLYQRLF